MNTENNQIKIWRMSHGTAAANMTNNDHELLIQNNMVAIGFAKPLEDNRNQRETFSNINGGDYFYLVRNHKIVLLARFSDESINSPPENFSMKDWVARKFELIKKLDKPITNTELKLENAATQGMPSQRRTVSQVPQEMLGYFEKNVLTPVFNLTCAELAGNPIPTHNLENEKIMINSLNRILYGPPGTGKTYNTVIEALKILEGEKFLSSEYEEQKKCFDNFKREGQIEFVTFHQSFSYEDFVEGIRASTKDGIISYYIEPGIFKIIAEEAERNKDKKYVLIIDEINRGNISRIFGELITLIEPSKRLGTDEAITVKLPYSKDKDFGVPNNLYIIGTMNTADRSLALMDTALRRRFDFIEMMPNPKLIKTKNHEALEIEGVNIQEMLSVMNHRILALYDREHTIGHAFFMKLNEKSTINDLALIFKNKILPLLEEYFFEDWEKISKVLGISEIYKEKPFSISNLGFEYSGKTFSRDDDALKNPNTYLNIYKKHNQE